MASLAVLYQIFIEKLSTIPNSQKVQEIQMSLEGWMDKYIHMWTITQP